MPDAIQNWITELQNGQRSALPEQIQSRISTAVAALNEIESGLGNVVTGADGTVLSNITGSPGQTLTPNLLTLVLDHVFGSARGSLLERGAAGWTAFPPSSTNNLALTSAGTGSDLVWESAGQLLNSISTTQGAITYFGPSGQWTALTPGAAGSLLQSGGAGANPSWSTLGQIAGTATNDSASAGNIGEYFSSTVASGSAVALTSNTSLTVTSISLTAGDWDVSADIAFVIAGTTVVFELVAGVALVPNNVNLLTPGNFTSIPYPATTVANGRASIPVAPIRYSLSATTTIYVSAQASFATSTCSAYGILRARRVR
jgi:hypothetical protein